MIICESISKRLGSIQALKEVSFQIPECRVTGLLGPNGAGKSTTLRILTTLLTPDSGRALVGGYDTSINPQAVRASLGYLPEHPPLYRELRVKEYLEIAGELHGLRGAGLKEAIERTLGQCKLEGVPKRIIKELSKGFQQRVGIAQAILHKPQIIILDEPTSGLDPIQLVEMRELICNLGKFHTVVFSSHILQEVVETCSQVILLVDGEKQLDADISQLSNVAELEKKFLESVAGK